MIYIAQDTRSLKKKDQELLQGEIIEYHTVLSKKIIFKQSSKEHGCWITLKLWDNISNKYKKQRVFIKPVISNDSGIPLLHKNIYNVVKWDGFTKAPKGELINGQTAIKN